MNYINKLTNDSKKGARKIARHIINNYDRGFSVNRNVCFSSNLTKSIFEGSPHIYLNPTENLVIGNYIKQGDDVATVFSSGDFMLEAAHHGANSVVGFDINNSQYFIGMLKVLALQVLDYNDYYDFFSNPSSNKFLSPEIYRKIKSSCPKLSIFDFWDVLMKQRSREIKLMKKSKFYSIIEMMDDLDCSPMGMLFKNMVPDEMISLLDDFSEYNFYNTYLELTSRCSSKIFHSIQGENGFKHSGSYIECEDSYLDTRSKLDRVKLDFYKADLVRFREVLGDKEKFDLIYLSNIPDYLSGNVLLNSIGEHLIPLLKDNGSIIYCNQSVSEDDLDNCSMMDVIDLRSRDDLNPDVIISNVSRANAIEGYLALSSRYDISIDMVDSISDMNVIDNPKDVYVKVKK